PSAPTATPLADNRLVRLAAGSIFKTTFVASAASEYTRTRGRRRRDASRTIIYECLSLASRRICPRELASSHPSTTPAPRRATAESRTY
ncbi:hypothetical protein LSAT2_017434, partial [Lamellibrachia satsuma]